MSSDIEVVNKYGKLGIVVEGPCPKTCTSCRSETPGVRCGKHSARAPLDPDKTHTETRKLLNIREEHNRQNARPSLQDLFDAERAAKEKPVVVPERKPSPDKVHAESRRILQTAENLRKMESQEAMEKADKQFAESKKLLQTVRRWEKPIKGSLAEWERTQSKELSEEQQNEYQKTIQKLKQG